MCGIIDYVDSYRIDAGSVLLTKPGILEYRGSDIVGTSILAPPVHLNGTTILASPCRSAQRIERGSQTGQNSPHLAWSDSLDSVWSSQWRSLPIPIPVMDKS
jgi:hypothetical protein